MLQYIAISQYGLRLHQMRDADIEIVREGRNQPFVRKNHFFQEIITPEQHRSWYDGICKTRDYYLIVCKDDVPLGLISLKNIAPGMHTGQLGIFFWEKQVLRTRLPLLAIITFIDFFLVTVGIQHMEAIIRSTNTAMAHIFEFFGFDLFYDNAKQILKTSSTRNQYLENHDRLIDFVKRLNKYPASDRQGVLESFIRAQWLYYKLWSDRQGDWPSSLIQTTLYIQHKAPNFYPKRLSIWVPENRLRLP